MSFSGTAWCGATLCQQTPVITPHRCSHCLGGHRGHRVHRVLTCVGVCERSHELQVLLHEGGLVHHGGTGSGHEGHGGSGAARAAEGTGGQTAVRAALTGSS